MKLISIRNLPPVFMVLIFSALPLLANAEVPPRVTPVTEVEAHETIAALLQTTTFKYFKNGEIFAYVDSDATGSSFEATISTTLKPDGSTPIGRTPRS